MSKAESADLLMKLYDLRREEKMREARAWMIGFFPESPQDVMQAMLDPKTSAYYRMVVTYWDMAASFVNHGAIDEEMFTEASGEGVVMFAKIEPFLKDLRETMGNPNYLGRLESWIMRMPDAQALCAQRREMIKGFVTASQEMAKAQAN